MNPHRISNLRISCPPDGLPPLGVVLVPYCIVGGSLDKPRSVSLYPDNNLSVRSGELRRSGGPRASKASGEPFADTTEPNHDAPHVGLEHVTRGNARVPPDDSTPGAAARQAILSAVRALRVGFRAVAIIRQRVPVLHPLPDVPQH